MNPEEQKRFTRLNSAWLGGEKIDVLKFLHNSMVEATLPDKSTKTGWIVAASTDGPEPIYTVEAQDGSGDIEVPESGLKCLEQ
jgi:hypothetical protein